MNQLILMRGLPGSGKSSLARYIASLSPGRVFECCTDDYFVGADGVYRWNAGLLDVAHEACYEKAVTAMADEVETVIVHNTFTRDREMQMYIQSAEDFGYRVITLVVENRHGSENIHGAPIDTLIKMRERFKVVL